MCVRVHLDVRREESRVDRMGEREGREKERISKSLPGAPGGQRRARSQADTEVWSWKKAETPRARC